MSLLSKKQRKEHPRKLSDSDSLARVASPFGPIRTPVASPLDKEIVIERLRKEIVERFDLKLSVPRQSRMLLAKDGLQQSSTTPSPAKRVKREHSPRLGRLLSRLRMGTNQCTRALEAAVTGSGPAPSVILLARDVFPPTILAHIPGLAKQVGTPILLLPGKATGELGKAIGVKRTAIVLFLPSSDEKNDAAGAEDHRRIDSFVNFVLSKVPSEETR